MARNTATWLQPMTLLLMAITYAAVEVASDPDGIPSAFGLIFGAVAFPVAWVIGRVLTRGVPPSAWVVGRFLTGGVVSSSSCRALPRWVTGVLCLLLIGPVLMEPLLRSWTT
jgi:RsiW-degrading membrane proteinase PrsW (M82 family)